MRPCNEFPKENQTDLCSKRLYENVLAVISDQKERKQYISSPCIVVVSIGVFNSTEILPPLYKKSLPYLLYVCTTVATKFFVKCQNTVSVVICDNES